MTWLIKKKEMRIRKEIEENRIGLLEKQISTPSLF